MGGQGVSCPGGLLVVPRTARPCKDFAAGKLQEQGEPITVGSGRPALAAGMKAGNRAVLGTTRVLDVRGSEVGSTKLALQSQAKRLELKSAISEARDRPGKPRSLLLSADVRDTREFVPCRSLPLCPEHPGPSRCPPSARRGCLPQAAKRHCLFSVGVWGGRGGNQPGAID